jgi:hypothetical protein
MAAFIKVLIISLFIISCQGLDNKLTNKIKTFNLKELPQFTLVKLSDLGFTDIEYIPMETNEQSLIPGSYDLVAAFNRLIFGNGIFIIKHFNTIFEFRNDGSFVTRIGSAGRGPYEFQAAHDVEIDERNNYIYIVDGWKKRVFVYSANGEFLRIMKIPLYGVIDFRLIEDGFLCYNENLFGNVENSYNFIDTIGRIKKKFPNNYLFNKYKNVAFSYQHENLFYRFNHQLFKKEIYSDTIYVFDNKNFKPHLVLEVGNRLITPKARSEFDGTYLGKNYITPLNLLEFGDYIYYEYLYEVHIGPNNTKYGFIGSKRNNIQTFINADHGLQNDIDGGLNILPQTIKDDNTIVAFIDPLQLKKHVASEAFKNSTPIYPDKKKALIKLADSLKETDNPVLMLVKLKK